MFKHSILINILNCLKIRFNEENSNSKTPQTCLKNCKTNTTPRTTNSKNTKVIFLFLFLTQKRFRKDRSSSSPSSESDSEVSSGKDRRGRKRVTACLVQKIRDGGSQEIEVMTREFDYFVYNPNIPIRNFRVKIHSQSY